ncbi:MAG: glutamate--tRNA ligase [Thermoplasmatota archaeon]
MTDDITTLARKHALLNAAEFDGEAQVKAVIGKVMAAVDADPKEVIPVVRQAVAAVNELSLEEQQAEIAEHDYQRREAEREEGLPELPHAVQGEVVTRFPPEPNGYLHIGHAKAAIVDHEYARRYNGTFILRFDDTNPASESMEYYEAQREGLRWLGIEWDREYRTSDNLPRHYELAEQLIGQGDAYLCTCPPDTVKDNRRAGRACACLDSMTMDKWHDFFDMEAGSAVLRLAGDMQSDNTAMRDPTLFRIIDEPHPVHGTSYRVWPTYDFTGAIEDSLSGVTHPFRTKEYELRDEVYFYLLERLGLRKPHLMEFARLSIQGMPVSKRKIRPLIEDGLVEGWDDPRLPTLLGLRRRGIQPEAIREFVLSQGISRAESTVTFDQVEAFNRKLLDPDAKRYFYVPDPVAVHVEEAPETSVALPHHPSRDLGERYIETGTLFYIPGGDAQAIAEGDIFRLKDLYNVEVLETGDDGIGARYAGDELLPGTAKLQWVTEEHVDMEVWRPGALVGDDGSWNPDSLPVDRGIAEEAARHLSRGDIVQFERYGFVRVDAPGRAILAHK